MYLEDVPRQKERPAYVGFERVAIEDPIQTAAQGRFIARDVDMAMITPPGSRDIFKIEVTQWLLNMRQDVRNGRLPQEWMDQYLTALEKWKAGQELPLHGTPIRGWAVLSPAQQTLLTSLMILTVEDLAQLNDEGIQRIGMGAMDLRTKARAWLSQAQDKGPLTIENAQLKQSLITQQGEIETLKAQVAQLTARIQMDSATTNTAEPSLDIDDLLTETTAAPRAKRK